MLVNGYAWLYDYDILVGAHCLEPFIVWHSAELRKARATLSRKLVRERGATDTYRRSMDPLESCIRRLVLTSFQ